MPDPVWRVFGNAGRRWFEDRAPTGAAAMAFYTIFSLPPVLLIALAVAGFAFGEDEARAGLFAQIADLVGPRGARAIRDMIESAGRAEGGTVALIVGPVVFVVGATAVFAQLQATLNDIWDVKAEEFSLWRFLRHRLVSFALIVVMGFLMAVSLALDTVAVALGVYLFGGLASAILAWALQAALAFGMLTLMFALMFKVLPDAVVEWRDVWLGGALTALLFTAGKSGIGFYFATTDLISSYGAPGTFIVVLLWVYYSSLILLYGAEVTREWQRRRHRRRASSRPPHGGRRRPRTALFPFLGWFRRSVGL